MEQFLESLYVNRELHAVMFEPICRKYTITLTELLVLMFLKFYNMDTAKEIVKKLKLAKSHVSTSVHDLEKKGLIACIYDDHDRRTIHLQVCKGANEIISEGYEVQKAFSAVLMDGFTNEEKANLMEYISRITENANTYLKEVVKK